ncbi:unnamed protein product (macronuclear) [Paramecium tetraurelia]|uniref:EF-hand domain-containing protein n=1 Tax=Paramecium tetraurelia TaxID=5888 RepID=A0DL69_PARTE|nr:uncharacterized protein GSPATT00018103001 [Paramecium tetraurelia]CAK83786.1 unnamed protein product [Paramecium tetraurelia]|eukprot:XP_001451183.1 hypothetical protein (macronuclear) [Paramecium tetraurelia strain d4-2]
MTELLLIMNVRIDEGRQGTINVHFGDDPEVLARDFCIEYNVNQKLVPLLIENINKNLEVAEQQKVNSGQDTMQYSTETCNSKFMETPFNEPLHQLSMNNYYSTHSSVHDRLYEDAKNKRLKQKLNISDSRSKKIKIQEPEINYGLFLYQKGIKKNEEKLQRAESAKKDLQNSQLVECTHHPRINHVSKQLVQRKGESVSEHLNRLAQEQKIKRENASQEHLKSEVQSCSFKPQINRISRYIVEERNDRSNQPWYEQLYTDYDSKRQKLEQLEKQYFSSNYTFHPKIDMISEKIVQGSSFEQRQKIRSTSRQNLSVCDDDSQLFKPKTGRPPEKRPRDLFQNLYNQAKIWEKKRQNKIVQIHQQQMSTSQVRASEKSNQMIQSQMQVSLIKIFNALDSDNDGFINSENCDVGDLDDNVIKILSPLLLEMESGNHTLNKKEFVESAERLVATLSPCEKYDLLKKPILMCVNILYMSQKIVAAKRN